MADASLHQLPVDGWTGAIDSGAALERVLTPSRRPAGHSRTATGGSETTATAATPTARPGGGFYNDGDSFSASTAAPTPINADGRGASPSSASKKGNKRKLRLKGWAKHLDVPTAELLQAAVANDVEAGRRAIEEGADYNAVHKDKLDSSVLHLACCHEEPDFLLLLLNLSDGLKPRWSSNRIGQTPIHAAAISSRSPTTVPLLVTAYELALHKDYRGNNFLHKLVENSVMSMPALCQTVEWVLRCHGGPRLLNVQNTFTMTVLDVAIMATEDKTGAGAMQELLFRFGARRGSDVNVTHQEQISQEERKDRGDIMHHRDETLRQILLWHRRCVDDIAAWARHVRRIDRLAEKESLRRHELQTEGLAALAALIWSSEAQLAAIRRMERVIQEDRGATKVQSLWRRVLTRRQYKLHRAESSKRFHAAARIQAVCRGVIARRSYKELKEQQEAAVAVQRLFRGFLGREKNKHMREGIAARETAAAMSIQCFYRNRRVKLHVLRREREHEERIRQWADESHKALEATVSKLQSLFRMRAAKSAFVSEKEKIVAIQAATRRHLAIAMRKELNIKRKATDMVLTELRRRRVMGSLRAHAGHLMELRIQERVKRTKWKVFTAIWRWQFVSSIQQQHTFEVPPGEVPSSSTAVVRSGGGEDGPKKQQQQPLLHRFLAERDHSRTGWLSSAAIDRRQELVLDVVAMLIAAAILASTIAHPRSDDTRLANNGDIAGMAILGVRWLISAKTIGGTFDFIVVVASAVCAALGVHHSVVLCTLILLRAPMLFAFGKSNITAQCISHGAGLSVRVFFHVLPIFLVLILLPIRLVTYDESLLSSNGNMASTLHLFMSTNAPLIESIRFVVWGTDYDNTTFAETSDAFSSSSANELLGARKTTDREIARFRHSNTLVHGLSEDEEIVVFQEKLLVSPILVTLLAMFAAVLGSVVVGLNAALRNYFELEDKSLMKDKKIARRRQELAELHSVQLRRAATLEEAEQQLTIDLQNEVRAAKDAIEASHFDHNVTGSVRQFLKKVRSVLALRGGRDRQMSSPSRSPSARRFRKEVARASGGSAASSRKGSPISKSIPRMPLVATSGETHHQENANVGDFGEEMEWDCRNELTASRWLFDRDVIEHSLGRRRHTPLLMSVALRQLKGAVHHKEVTYLILASVVLSGVFPNCALLEGLVSGVLVLELIFSLKILGLGKVLLYHGGLGLLIRLAAIVVGFVPQTIPFSAVVRALRLSEGWSRFVSVSSVHRALLLAGLYATSILFLVSFAAAYQWDSSGASSTGVQKNSFCSDHSECAIKAIRMIVAPLDDDSHFDPVTTPPILSVAIVVFRLFVVPFVLVALLHPITMVASFSTKFLRLVVKAMNRDVVRTADHMTESEDWFQRRKYTMNVKPSIAAKMRVWAIRARKRCNLATERLDHRHLVTLEARAPESDVEAAALAAHLSNPILARSKVLSYEANEAMDEKMGHRKRSGLVVALRSLVRMKPLHIVHLLLTLASVAFLWMYPVDDNSNNAEAIRIASIVVHSVSMGFAVLLVPWDGPGVLLTLISCASLVVAIIAAETTYIDSAWFCLRFLSGLRLLTLKIGPFGIIRKHTSLLMSSMLRALLLILVAIFVTYIVFITWAQVADHVERASSTSSPSDVFDDSASGAFSDSGSGSGSMPVKLSMNESSSMMATVVPSIQERLVDRLQSDKQTLFTIFCFFLVPSAAVGSFFAHEQWSANVLELSNKAVVESIALLDEPLLVSRVPRPIRLFTRYVGPFVVCLTVAFHCLLSPSSTDSGTGDRLFASKNDFYTIEVTLMAVLAFDGFLRLIRSGLRVVDTLQSLVPRHLRLVGILCMAELMSFLYVAGTACVVALMMNGLYEEELEPIWRTYLVPIRFVLLLRFLNRHVKATLMQVRLWLRSAIIVCVFLFIFTTAVLTDFKVGQRQPVDKLEWGLSWIDVSEDLLRLTFSSKLPSAPIHADSRYGNIDFNTMVDESTGISNATLPGPSLPEYWINVTSQQDKERMQQQDLSKLLELFSATDTSLVTFLLSIFFKLMFAMVIGMSIAHTFRGWGVAFLYTLPPHAAKLYQFFEGGAAPTDPTGDEERQKFLNHFFERLFRPVARADRPQHHFLSSSQPMWVPPPSMSSTRTSKSHQRHRSPRASQKSSLNVSQQDDNGDGAPVGALSGGTTPRNNKRKASGNEKKFPPRNTVPRWMVPHILEELGILSPAHQRATLFLLVHCAETLLQLMHDRRHAVAEYMHGWDEFAVGGPSAVSIEKIPALRCDELLGDDSSSRKSSRKNSRTDSDTAIVQLSADAGDDDVDASTTSEASTTTNSVTEARVSALALVQAVAVWEEKFPCTTSIDSRLWQDALLHVRRVRAAVLFQSVYRMYSTIKRFERSHATTRMMSVASHYFRGRFRFLQEKRRAAFLLHNSLAEALRFHRRVFIPSGLHVVYCDNLKLYFVGFLLFPQSRPETPASSMPSPALRGRRAGGGSGSSPSSRGTAVASQSSPASGVQVRVNPSAYHHANRASLLQSEGGHRYDDDDAAPSLSISRIHDESTSPAQLRQRQQPAAESANQQTEEASTKRKPSAAVALAVADDSQQRVSAESSEASGPGVLDSSRAGGGGSESSSSSFSSSSAVLEEMYTDDPLMLVDTSRGGQPQPQPQPKRGADGNHHQHFYDEASAAAALSPNKNSLRINTGTDDALFPRPPSPQRAGEATSTVRASNRTIPQADNSFSAAHTQETHSTHRYACSDNESDN